MLVVKRGNDVNVVPAPGFVFETNDVIVLVGTVKSIDEISNTE
jgi:K+/H+ antiporter YhaU regulatory subunit KhtT